MRGEDNSSPRAIWCDRRYRNANYPDGEKRERAGERNAGKSKSRPVDQRAFAAPVSLGGVFSLRARYPRYDLDPLRGFSPAIDSVKRRRGQRHVYFPRARAFLFKIADNGFSLVPLRSGSTDGWVRFHLHTFRGSSFFYLYFFLLPFFSLHMFNDDVSNSRSFSPAGGLNYFLIVCLPLCTARDCAPWPLMKSTASVARF